MNRNSFTDTRRISGVSTFERARKSRVSAPTGAHADIKVVVAGRCSSRETSIGSRPIAQLVTEGRAERESIQLFIDVSAVLSAVPARPQDSERATATAAKVSSEQEWASRRSREGPSRQRGTAESTIPAARSQKLGDCEERG